MAPKVETSFLSTVLAPMEKTLVVVLSFVRSDGCVKGCSDVAARNKTRSERGVCTCVDGASATALSGGGGLGFDSLSDGRGDSNGSFAGGELHALADTLSVGGDCRSCCLERR